MSDYLNAIRSYARFTGRARRREFWMFWLVNGIILTVFQILTLAWIVPSTLTSQPGDALFPPGEWAVLGLFLLYSVFVFLPSLGINVRRLHDSGRSGWWYLVCFVPFIGSLVVLVFMVMDSEPGRNRWGPSPKDTAQASPVTANSW